ncbi:MAG: hypothetical protein K2N05_00670 [Muribaculaceae bacterium]|nr:hypothetical protein [Muribaculaceae bacterium]
MHPLTKEERRGAISLALLSLLICGGSALYGIYERNREVENERELVESIIIMADSSASRLQSERETDREYKYKRNMKENRRKLEKGKSSKRKGSGKEKDKKDKRPAPTRDFLSDPI